MARTRVRNRNAPTTRRFTVSCPRDQVQRSIVTVGETEESENEGPSDHLARRYRLVDVSVEFSRGLAR